MSGTPTTEAPPFDTVSTFGGFQLYPAWQLKEAPIEAPQWCVEGIIPAGLTLLVGKPKLGKSFFALEIAKAVALGRPAFGKHHATQGTAIFLALDDTRAEVQRRLKNSPDVDRNTPLLITGSAPPMQSDGTYPELEQLLIENPDTRLVVIDIFACVRPPTRSGAPLYGQDYQSLLGLKRLAEDRNVAILVLHHERKMRSTDWIDHASGSTGLTGAADAVLALEATGENEGKLRGRGKSFEEFALALKRETDSGFWSIVGDAFDVYAGKSEAAVYELIVEERRPMKPKAVAHALSMPEGTARWVLKKLYEARRIERDRDGGYFQPAQRVQGDLSL